jgi:hypothetical protein
MEQRPSCQLVKKFPAVSTRARSDPYPEPDESSPHLPSQATFQIPVYP